MPLAALAPVIIALFALLLIGALFILGKVLAQVFPSSIGIGSFSIHPRAWIEGGVDALAVGVKWLVGDVIRPLISLILSPVRSLLHWIGQAANLAAVMYEWADWLVRAGIPQLAGRLAHLIATTAAAVRAYADHRIAALSSTAWGWVDNARHYAASLVAALSTKAWGWVDAARHYAASLVAAARRDAWGWVSHARTYAAGLVTAAVHDLSAEITRAEALAKAGDQVVVSLVKSTATRTLTAAEGYTDKAVKAIAGGAAVIDVPALAGDVSGLAQDVTGLIGVLGADLPQLGDLLGELDLTDALTATLAMADTLTLSRVLTRYLRDCGVPNCRNLSAVGRALHDLFKAVEGAAFLALLVELVSDPAGMAREVNDVLGPVATTAAGHARDLLGV